MSLAQASTLRGRIVEWLREQPDGATREEIQLGCGVSTHGPTLKEMVEQGRLTREKATDKSGRRNWVYRAAPDGLVDISRKLPDSRAGQIRDWLRDHAAGGTVSEISRDLGASSTQVSTACCNLLTQGDVVRCQVERPGQGVQWHYRLSAIADTPQAGQQWRTTPILKSGPNRETLRVGPEPVPASRPEPRVVVDATPTPITNTEAFAIKATPVSNAVAPEATPVEGSPRAPLPALAPARAADAPRFALYSDGTLIMEGLPHLPEIVAIHRDHARALVAYLRGAAA